jgi:hypothetical protein
MTDLEQYTEEEDEEREPQRERKYMGNIKRREGTRSAARSLR